MTFLFFALAVLIISSLTFLLGCHLHYQRGYWDGYQDCADYQNNLATAESGDDISSIRWACYSPPPSKPASSSDH